MSRFEQSHPHHEVHEVHRPQGHGYVDQKYGKGNRSPIAAQVPQIESGAVPGADGAGAPGVPSGPYAGGADTSGY
jgi:hypothetical protein